MIEKEKAQIQNEKLSLDFEKLSLNYSMMMAEKEESNNMNENIRKQLKDIQTLSEKRKTLLDEKVVELQEVIEKYNKKEIEMTEKLKEKEVEHQDTVNGMSIQNSDTVNELELKIQGLEEQIRDLSVWPDKYNTINGQLDESINEKTQLEQDLESKNNQFQDLEAQNAKMLHQFQIQQQKEINKMKKELEIQAQEYETQIELVNVQKCEFEEQVSKLRQEVRDSVEERKIHEKKGQSLVKDLKRQVQQERRRAEKLTEKMKECFETDSMLSETDREAGGLDADRTSISSWSLMSGERGSNQHLSAPSRGNSTPAHLSSSPLDQTEDRQKEFFQIVQENETLLARVAKLQETNWSLEEKLSMLEASGASMAEELVNKSKLINSYCMEEKKLNSTKSNAGQAAGENKMRSFVDKIDRFVHQPGPSGVQSKEVSNMQKMLEETLTKNMHLQQDLENMSLEVVRLSKLTNIK